ncbi:MAG: hypothetical protein AB7H92_09640 [Microbacteriaceae bacterium]
MTRRMLLSTGTAVLAGAAIAVSGIVASTAGSVDPGAVVSVLDAPRSARDALPQAFPASDFGIRAQTARWLGSDGPRDYWVALDDKRDVCILVSLGPRDTIGGACNSVSRIAASGQLVGVQGLDGVTYVAQLLPDAAAVPAAIGGGWSKVSDNLVVGVADASAVEVSIPVAGGGEIELRRS